MNDKQIDNLLEIMKERPCPTMDKTSEEAIVAGLHDGIRRQRRNTIAVSVVVLLVVVCVFIGRGFLKDDVQESIVEWQWTNRAKLAAVQELFSGTGIALVNGELITFEHDGAEAGEKLLGLCLHRINGKAPITFDVIVSDNDYIALKEGPITGEILVNRCSEHEVIVDVDLVFERPDGKKLKVKETVPMFPIGVGTGKGSVPEDYMLEFFMDTLHKG